MPTEDDTTEAARREFWAGRRARHGAFTDAVLADARITAQRRGERFEFRSRPDAVVQMIRLVVVSDAYLAQVLYRGKAALQAKGVPVVPRILHRLAMMTAQVSIGDPVVVEAGVYFPHGQVVIDGVVEVGKGTSMAPWSTIGLQAGSLLGGVVVIEQLFGLPGLGWTLLNGIYQRDYPVVQGTVLFFALVFALTNLLVDLTYSQLDPRIRYG